MRHRRKSLGLAVAVCVFALVATPALAHEFTASKTGKIIGTAVEPLTENPDTGEQEYPKGPNTQALKFGGFKIFCDKTAAKGSVAEGASETFATAIKFSKCWDEVKIATNQARLAARFKTPLAIEYHANGFVETGSELEEAEGVATLSGGEAELRIAGLVSGELKKTRCVIKWPEQTLPLAAVKKPENQYSAATFANVATPHAMTKAFPDGFQHSITVTNAFKNIKFEYEEGPCATYGKEDGPEGASGTYKGSFPQILTGGNFEFS